MLTMPAIGAYADLRAAKKRLLALSTLGCVLGTAALAGAGPGDVAWAVVAIVLSNVFYTYGESLIAAFLPELARQDSLGQRVGLGLELRLLRRHAHAGAEPGVRARGTGPGPAGIALRAGDHADHRRHLWRARAGDLCAAARSAHAAGAGRRTKPGCGRRWRGSNGTWRQARRFRDFSALLACSVAYQAGISVVIALAAVYAEQVMGFQQTQTMMLIFLVNIAAALGAFAWGYVQDRIGHRPALGITLAGWIVMTVLAALATGPGLVLGRGGDRRAVHGQQPVGRPGAGRRALRPRRSAPSSTACGRLRSACRPSSGRMTYGLGHLVERRQPPPGDRLDRPVFFVVGLLLLMLVNVQRGIAAARRQSAWQRRIGLTRSRRTSVTVRLLRRPAGVR